MPDGVFNFCVSSGDASSQWTDTLTNFAWPLLDQGSSVDVLRCVHKNTRTLKTRHELESFLVPFFFSLRNHYPDVQRTMAPLTTKITHFVGYRYFDITR